jgi:hypothetical protein
VLKGRRVVATSGLAHFTHDGFADMLYVFLPVWQLQFGLAFAEVGLFKMLLSGTLAALQLPASVAVLAFGWAATPVALGCLLFAAGVGESAQHPLSSALLANAFQDKIPPDGAKYIQCGGGYRQAGFPGLGGAAHHLVLWTAPPGWDS